MKRSGFVLPSLAALAFGVLPAAAFAVDVGGVTAADFESPEAKAIWSILAGQGPWGALLFGVIGVLYMIFKPMIAAWVKSRVSESQAAFISSLYNTVEAGVLGVKQAYVDAVKAASADGKLTEEEAKQARALCRQFVVDHFKAQGIDILKEYGHAALDMLIEAALGRYKLTAVKAVVAPLSDLVSAPIPELVPGMPAGTVAASG